MPAVTGLHFLPVFLLSVWLLDQIPAPTPARTSRSGPCASQCTLPSARSSCDQFLLGLILLGVAYLFLTAYRDFRDNYVVEILDGLGYAYAGQQDRDQPGGDARGHRCADLVGAPQSDQGQPDGACWVHSES